MNTVGEAAHKTVAVEWRKAREGRERGEPLSRDHEEDVRFALQTDQHLADDEEPSRVVTIRAQRPKGKTELIKRQEQTSKQPGGASKSRFVPSRRARTFRAVEKRLIVEAGTP
ncbi:MAG: hypothetical protein ACR2GC_12610 [Methyloceanibacter sp.]|uniref:hypothetical protein n=1 Tax=Methyloceanibacter sp. TaxID=1965321 RepID=UPI003D9B4128